MVFIKSFMNFGKENLLFLDKIDIVNILGICMIKFIYVVLIWLLYVKNIIENCMSIFLILCGII